MQTHCVMGKGPSAGEASASSDRNVSAESAPFPCAPRETSASGHLPAAGILQAHEPHAKAVRSPLPPAAENTGGAGHGHAALPSCNDDLQGTCSLSSFARRLLAEEGGAPSGHRDLQLGFVVQARQKEKVKGSNLLMNLTGDGRNLILTEDEKLWGMVEKYFILEFDVDTPPTAESNLKKKARAVSILQRKWRNVQASKRWHDALSAIKSGLADRSLGGNKTVTVSGTAALDGTERPPSISSQLRRKLLWEQLIEASMPDSIERLIDDMENIEAVGKIHHAMGRSRAKRGSG